jgi:hypothetical protein
LRRKVATDAALIALVREALSARAISSTSAAGVSLTMLMPSLQSVVHIISQYRDDYDRYASLRQTVLRPMPSRSAKFDFLIEDPGR